MKHQPSRINASSQLCTDVRASAGLRSFDLLQAGSAAITIGKRGGGGVLIRGQRHHKALY